ncbi:hypothetical protein D3C71_2166640 [compost metagenome]
MGEGLAQMLLEIVRGKRLFRVQLNMFVCMMFRYIRKMLRQRTFAFGDRRIAMR